MCVRHGSLGLSVVCFARLSILCQSFRVNADYDSNAADEECLHVAKQMLAIMWHLSDFGLGA